MKKSLFFALITLSASFSFAGGAMERLEQKILTSEQYAKTQKDLAKGLIKVEDNHCSLKEVLTSQSKYGTLSDEERVHYKTAIMACTRLITYKTGGVNDDGTEGINTDANHYILLINLQQNGSIISISSDFPPQAG